MTIRTQLPYAGQSLRDLFTFLSGKNVKVAMIDVDPTGQIMVIDADQDVAALVGTYTPPDPGTRVTTRDHIAAAIQAKNYAEAMTRLLAAVSLPDDGNA